MPFLALLAHSILRSGLLFHLLSAQIIAAMQKFYCIAAYFAQELCRSATRHVYHVAASMGEGKNYEQTGLGERVASRRPIQGSV
jgi:hypothetical protein